MRVFPKIFTFLNNDARLILRGKLLRILRRQAAFSFAVLCIIMFNFTFFAILPGSILQKRWTGGFISLYSFLTMVAINVAVKSKLQHSSSGIPRAFHVFSCPGRRALVGGEEFDR